MARNHEHDVRDVGLPLPELPDTAFQHKNLPLPEIVDGGIWTVREADDPLASSAGLGPTGGEMTVSFGDDGQSLTTQAHELGHARWTPRNFHKKYDKDMAYQHAEDARIWKRLDSAGVELSPILHGPHAQVDERLTHDPISTRALLVSTYGLPDKDMVIERARALGVPEGDIDLARQIHERYFSDEWPTFDSTVAAAQSIKEGCLVEMEPGEEYEPDEEEGDGESEEEADGDGEEGEGDGEGDGKPGKGSKAGKSEGGKGRPGKSEGDSSEGDGEGDDDESEGEGEGGDPEDPSGAAGGGHSRPSGSRTPPGVGDGPRYDPRSKPAMEGETPEERAAREAAADAERKELDAERKEREVEAAKRERERKANIAKAKKEVRNALKRAAAAEAKREAEREEVDPDLTPEEAYAGKLSSDHLMEFASQWTDMDVPDGRMEITTPALTMKLPANLRGRGFRSSIYGQRLGQVHRTQTDAVAFRTKLPKPRGGAVLIDRSGSMGLEDDQILELMAAAPAVIIATYSGHYHSGELRIVAKNGRRVPEYMLDPPGGCNMIDCSALMWLGQQPQRPRIWISDGGVSGYASGGGEFFCRGRAVEAARLCRAYGIHRIDDMERLLEDIRQRKLR